MTQIRYRALLLLSALVATDVTLAQDAPVAAPSATEFEQQPQWPSLEEVTARFETQFAAECEWALQGGERREPEVFELSYRYDYDEAEVPDRRLQLYRFFCDAGAYNEQHVFYTVTEDVGVRPLLFAEPQIVPIYDPSGPDQVEDAKVETIQLTGFIARYAITNSAFDPATGIISSDAKWRGIGDASSHGEYEQEGETFVLKRFDVDASYDGEINPVTVLDHYATN